VFHDIDTAGWATRGAQPLDALPGGGGRVTLHVPVTAATFHDRRRNLSA
jgi:hypothetical protein